MGTCARPIFSGLSKNPDRIEVTSIVAVANFLAKSESRRVYGPRCVFIDFQRSLKNHQKIVPKNTNCSLNPSIWKAP